MMKPGVYNSDDPDGEFGIKNMPDSWISIERNWHDIEYDGFPLKVEIVKYLDGSVCCNCIKFVNSIDEISFVESVDDVMIYDDPIQEKFKKLINYIESQLC